MGETIKPRSVDAEFKARLAADREGLSFEDYCHMKGAFANAFALTIPPASARNSGDG